MPTWVSSTTIGGYWGRDVSITNTTGGVTPLAEIVALAARVGARVLVDGAQAAARLRVDVRSLGCDFYALAGHKLYGPAGIGALYARRFVRRVLPSCAPPEALAAGPVLAELLAAAPSLTPPSPTRRSPASTC